jgi:hypothetical protein
MQYLSERKLIEKSSVVEVESDSKGDFERNSDDQDLMICEENKEFNEEQKIA